MDTEKQIIVPDMPHLREIYRIFRDGSFISELSFSESKRRYFRDLDTHYEAYFKYFGQLGLYLERGNGYFHLSEDKNSQRVQNSIRADFHPLLTVLRLLTMWNPEIAPGFQFKSYDLQQFCDENDEAKRMLPDSKDDLLASRVSDFLAMVEKQGFIDIAADKTTCMVTSAFSYLQKYILSIRLYGQYSKYDYLPEDSIEDPVEDSGEKVLGADTELIETIEIFKENTDGIS